MHVWSSPGATGRCVRCCAGWSAVRGRAAASRVLRARSRALTELVERLEPEQQEALRTGLEALLPEVYEHVGLEQLVCRLCDRAACVTGGATCPVGAAAASLG